jgi:hypothetical protein
LPQPPPATTTNSERRTPWLQYILDDYQLLEITSLLTHLIVAIYDIGVYHLPCRLLDPNSDYRIDDLHQEVTELIERLTPPKFPLDIPRSIDP